MANQSKSRARTQQIAENSEMTGVRYCSVPVTPEPTRPTGLNRARAEAIIVTENKWANGTVLHYYFFDLAENPAWGAAESQREVVRRAFKFWKELGIGLEFKEVADRTEAELRIGFQQGDGSWSYLGTDALKTQITGGQGERTINYGWDLTQPGPNGFDTALHEIGHALGLPHEHQNPFAGIVWDEKKVYEDLAGSPNFWSREKTFHNIIRKLSSATVKGSGWDPNSIMHYPFKRGLILKPERYKTEDLEPAGGLSAADAAWVLRFYPTLVEGQESELQIATSRQLALANGEETSFSINPSETRKYNIQVFGACDTQLVLQEMRDHSWRYMAQDDDSGEERNANFNIQLVKDRKYKLRVRMRYNASGSTPAIMMW